MAHVSLARETKGEGKGMDTMPEVQHEGRWECPNEGRREGGAERGSDVLAWHADMTKEC
jgi:hypothetical protein